MNPSRLLSVFAILLLASAGARADWLLDADASAVSFVSVKNALIAESHRFESFSGSVDADGAELVIDLASAETLIPIRNERMREMLFQVAQFPQARFNVDLGADVVSDMAPGEAREMQISGRLAIHGAEVMLDANVIVVRMGNGDVSVASARPVVVSADALNLGAGVEALRDVAGLTSITPMVPVSFSLVFREQP